MKPRARLLSAFSFALAMAACSSAAPPFDAKAVATEWAAFMQRDYVLRSGDRLTVRVEPVGEVATQEARDNLQEVTVSPTGTIDLRDLPAPLQVSGRSVGALRTLIVDAYKAAVYTEAPKVSVMLTEASTQSVYVSGEVTAPGVIPFHPGMSLTQAMAAAGGFTHLVRHEDIRVLRINQDGSQRTFRVNLEAVLEDEWPDFLLLPGDVVYAQASAIANAGYAVDLYIRRLLPFQLGGPALGAVN
jgi:polysaccharide export outer membrane protein